MTGPLKIVCPDCGAALKGGPAAPSRKNVRCPRCRASFRLPTVPAPLPRPVAPPRHSTAIGLGAWRMPILAAIGTGVFCLVALSAVILLLPKNPAHAAAPPGAAPDEQASSSRLSQQVRAILETNCFRCHGENGAAESGVFVLDRDKLVARKKVIPGDPEHSRLFQRLTSGTEPMPPEDETPRPSAADIALVREWIAAGAPAFTTATATAAGLLDTRYLLTAVRNDLLKVPEQDRKYQRYFTLCHVYNNPAHSKNLGVYRAALSRLVNSLSWKKTIVVPRAVDSLGTVIALDLREVDWESPDRWQDVVRAYPYGLRLDRGVNAGLRPLAEEVERLAGQSLPCVRADWFIATASRPPLYHSLLALPGNARQLEQQLGVDLPANFLNNKLRRAGFLKSNVSSQNRLIERHDTRFGAYWKSYDFRSSQNRESLVGFPLGPGPAFIPNHPFPAAAFEQAGGEIIFHLPNGLQGYMLVDGRDNRIDVAPIEVVRDRQETSGTPQIVTGLSCMACHVNGTINGDNVKDVIRDGSAAEGDAGNKVEQLYVAHAEMDRLLQGDAERFLRAVRKTRGPNQAGSTEEPISAVARPFVKKGIDLNVAALELGLADPEALRRAIHGNRTLRQLGLEPLALGNAIQRASWEQVQGNQSLFQRVAVELGLGTPVR